MGQEFSRQDVKTHKTPCITLIGMPGAGKSTVGQALAQMLGWGLVDTDHLIEAVYGAPLQYVADAMSKEAFLDVEAQVVLSLRMFRTVLATGGSVVYREKAMRHLRSLGPVVHLDVDLPILEERIARKPDRGLAIGPGQSIRDLFEERQLLYERYAQCRLTADKLAPMACARAVLAALREERLMF